MSRVVYVTKSKTDKKSKLEQETKKENGKMIDKRKEKKI